jgi:hypothetical protein
VPLLPSLIDAFLLSQEDTPPAVLDEDLQDRSPLAPAQSVQIYTSAVATFRAPSDWSGVRGMKRERIRATHMWRGKGGRYDMVFLNGDEGKPGAQGLLLCRVLRFMRMKTTSGDEHACALVHWWTIKGSEPDEDTGMWISEPDLDINHEPMLEIIHLDTVIRAAHLIPEFGAEWTPHKFSYTDSLDKFETFYVNKYADHHAFTIAF